MKKKLLIFSDYFIPGFKAGGPIKSILNLSNMMDKSFDIYVVTRDKDFGDLDSYNSINYDTSNVFNNINVFYLNKINIITINKYIKKIDPDLIYLNSFFSKITQIVLFLKKIRLVNCEIILAPRGELLKGAASLKSQKKKVFLRLAKLCKWHGKDLIFHATNDIETNNLKSRFSNKIFEIPNLAISQNVEFVNKGKKSNILNIIFLSRISEKKNLLFALNILKKLDDENIVFDIYGPKEDLKYWERCEKLMSSFKNIKISYKGLVRPLDVATTLGRYQCFLLPTLDENFGHAIVESMQMGVIPVISDQTPWNDVQKFEAGWALDLCDEYGFVEALKEIQGYNGERFSKVSKNAQNYINERLDTSKSIDMYNDMFSRSIK